MSSYSSVFNTQQYRKKLNHPTLMRWIKEEKNRLISSNPPLRPPVQHVSNADSDDLCKKCFPNGMLPKEGKIIEGMTSEEASKRFVFEDLLWMMTHSITVFDL